MSNNIQLTEEEVQIILEHRKNKKSYTLQNSNYFEKINFKIEGEVISVYEKTHSIKTSAENKLFDITSKDAKPLKQLLEKAFPSEHSNE